MRQSLEQKETIHLELQGIKQWHEIIILKIPNNKYGNEINVRLTTTIIFNFASFEVYDFLNYLRILHQIKFSIDDKQTSCGLFVDLFKAFGTVNHQILSRQLEQNGIVGKALDILKNRKRYSNGDGFIGF